MRPSIDRFNWENKGYPLMNGIRDRTHRLLSKKDILQRWDTDIERMNCRFNDYLSGKISTERVDPYLDYLPNDVRNFLKDDRMPIRLMYSFLTILCLFGLEITVIQAVKEFGKEGFKIYLVLNCLTSFRFNLLRDNRVAYMRIFLISMSLLLTCFYYDSLVLGYILALRFIKDIFLSNQCKNKGNKTVANLLCADKIGEALAYQAIVWNLMSLPLLISLYVLSLISSLIFGNWFDTKLGVNEVEEGTACQAKDKSIENDESKKDNVNRDKGIKDLMSKGAHITFGTSMLMAVSYVPSPLISRGLSPDSFNVDQMLSILSYMAAFGGLISTRTWEYFLKGKERSLDEVILRLCLVKTTLYASLYFLESPYQWLVFPALGFTYALLRFVVRSSVNLFDDKKLFYFWTALSFGGLLTFYVFSFMSEFMPLYCLTLNLIIQLRLYMIGRDEDDGLSTMIEESRKGNIDPNTGLFTLYFAGFSSLIMYSVFGFGFQSLLLLTFGLWALYYVNLGNWFYNILRVHMVSVLEILFNIRSFMRDIKTHLDLFVDYTMDIVNGLMARLGRIRKVFYNKEFR